MHSSPAGILRFAMRCPSIAISLLSLASVLSCATAQCISGGDDGTINNILSSSGEGAVVSLCPGATIVIYNTIQFTADNQEISTQGYPTDSSRATIIIGGGSLSQLIGGFGFSGTTLRSIQIDGNEPNLGHVDSEFHLHRMGRTGFMTVVVVSLSKFLGFEDSD